MRRATVLSMRYHHPDDSAARRPPRASDVASSVDATVAELRELARGLTGGHDRGTAPLVPIAPALVRGLVELATLGSLLADWAEADGVAEETVCELITEWLSLVLLAIDCVRAEAEVG